MTTLTTAGNPPPDEPNEPATPEEVAAEILGDEAQKRQWLRAIVPLLQLRSHESDPSDRVQFAFDRLFIAACERAARILRSDLANEG